MIKFMLNRSIQMGEPGRIHCSHYFPGAQPNFALKLMPDIENWLIENNITDYFVTTDGAKHGKCFLCFNNASDAMRFKLAEVIEIELLTPIQ